MKRIGRLGLVVSSAMLYLVPPSWPLAQDVLSKGAEQQVFNNACRTCHSIQKDDNRLGPNLHQIIGRKAGSLPDYNYSAAMRNSDFIWDEAKLARFIANPDEVVPGNKMTPYGGLSSVEDRKKIVLFLRSMRSQ
ncbi:c-type cytochrome [Bradyrhizobium sp. CCBAU 45384]|uniref:c-type cytochrome n=1 Tax=Bradyrhizobium sp. CCBAU 45384 TaxID=858428 RepID=UPI0023063C84|nr:c-type cytochrome [Bradyrhizobium sp. CCBAU 45384]MDA9406015.1 cytochrome C [Bradyrhizobium sp. CCBAU 45384]